MRATLGKAVRAEFANSMMHRLPSFHRMKGGSGSGNVPFEWSANPKLRYYVNLDIDPKNDEFTVDVAWNTKAGYPMQAMNWSKTEKPVGGAMRLRLSLLWSDEDYWWSVSPKTSEEQWNAWLYDGIDFDDEPIEKGLERIPKLVDDAVSQICKYAIPFFQMTAKKLGIEIGQFPRGK